jgi:hypothetical protein
VNRVTQALREYETEVREPAQVARAELINELIEMRGLSEHDARKLASSVPIERLARIGEQLSVYHVGYHWRGCPHDTLALLEEGAECRAIDDIYELGVKLTAR